MRDYVCEPKLRGVKDLDEMGKLGVPVNNYYKACLRRLRVCPQAIKLADMGSDLFPLY